MFVAYPLNTQRVHTVHLLGNSSRLGLAMHLHLHNLPLTIWFADLV